MVKTLYILCFLSSLWFCQAVGATPSLYEQEVSVVRSEYPSLVPIDLVYLPRKADYISGCGVRKDLKCIDAALIALILQKIYFPLSSTVFFFTTGE